MSAVRVGRRLTVAICLGAMAGLGSFGLGRSPGPGARALVGQDASGSTVSIDPDSVRVGEPFRLGVSIIRQTPGEIQFPALIELPEELEQRGPVQIRSAREGREWQADYTLVAWLADTLSIPALELLVGEGQGRPLSVELPAIVVHSILPAETSDLELREARPLLRIQRFPWWLIALGVVLAGLLWWWLRRRREPGPGLVALGPGARAIGEFERLRKAWVGGQLSSDGFYDGYEATLRRYARATRGWAPSRGLFALAEDSALVSALRHSLLARFARVRAREDVPIEDIEVGEAYVRSEMSAEGSSATPEASAAESPVPEASSSREDLE